MFVTAMEWNADWKTIGWVGENHPIKGHWYGQRERQNPDAQYDCHDYHFGAYLLRHIGLGHSKKTVQAHRGNEKDAGIHAQAAHVVADFADGNPIGPVARGQKMDKEWGCE